MAGGRPGEKENGHSIVKPGAKSVEIDNRNHGYRIIKQNAEIIQCIRFHFDDSVTMILSTL